MKITVVTCAKLKDSHTVDQFNKYASRLKGHVDLQFIELSGKESAVDKYIRNLPPRAQLIAMDERGRTVDSYEFAKIMGDNQYHGGANQIFLIGMPEGLPQVARTRADMLVSLSPLTMPYQLAFNVLVEQIYRGHTILTGHPYNK